MDRRERVETVRGQARELGFESPSRGAVAQARLGYDLPASESLPQQSNVDRAMAIIQRTIRHSHATNDGLDQHGNGYWVMFARHVTEGARRWDFEIDVEVDRAGKAAIVDVRVARSGPGGDDDDGAGDDERAAERPLPLTPEQLLPSGMIACPCCGHATLEMRGGFEICPVCFWEDDGQDNDDADVERGGPNQVSLTAGRVSYLRIGASVERDRSHVRGPTAEEVRLRRFGDDGREL